MTALLATDLDRTLIYSRAALDRWGSTSELVAVASYRGAAASFVTGEAAIGLAELGACAVVVPVTTRTVAQLARVRLPGPGPRWSVAANGGVLLEDGVRDEGWSARVRARLGTVAPLDQVLAAARAACRPEWTSALRSADDLFCYAVVDRALLPPDVLAEQRAWAAGHGWTVSLQGRKLYWVPQPLTKTAAVAEIVTRTGAQRVLAAGDSLLDADLLEAADAGIVARHGELVASGWHAPHVVRTSRCGIAAGEDVVRWFSAQVPAVLTR